MKTQHIVAAVAITLLHLPSLAAADGSPDHTSHPPKPVTDANITGHVRNATTQEHLPYISITVKGTTLGTTTDATGHYMLKNLPAGDLVLEASMLGYKTEEKKVTTQADKLLEVNFDLEEDAVALDEVVVSATRNETSKKEAPIIVNVSSAKLFEGTSSATLAEGMNFQPGLRVENNCGNCGTTQLRINGLEGQYSQILIDSRPVFSSLAGVYGLEQLPVSMIERVEVIRGGGSALYGSSAIGGVMNIITKEPLRNFASLANTTSVLPGGKTDINTSLNASLVSDDRKAGVYLFGMLKNRDWYDRNGDGFSDIPEINAQTLGFRGYYRTGDRSRLSAEYHHIHEFPAAATCSTALPTKPTSPSNSTTRSTAAACASIPSLRTTNTAGRFSLRDRASAAPAITAPRKIRMPTATPTTKPLQSVLNTPTRWTGCGSCLRN